MPTLEPLITGREARQLGRALAVYGLVGVAAGLMAVVFEEMIDWVSELLGVVPARYTFATEDALIVGLDFGQPFPWHILLIPALGALASGLICAWLAPEAMGSGGGQVIDAYHRRQGRIRHRVPVVKSVASAITIGSGGSAGYEGPISQIAAGIGAVVSDRLRLTARERRIIIVAGMAAGVGAVFHSPLAAAILAAEILYSDIDLEHEVLAPSIITSTIAFAVFGAVRGWEPAFTTPAHGFEHYSQLGAYAVLALAVALGAIGFVHTVTFFRRHLGKAQRLPLWLRPAIGGLGVGAVGLFVPQALGSGYGIIQVALDGRVGPLLLLLLAVTKTLTSALTTGSGGSGGLFAPAFVVGGALGGAVGLAAAALFPGLQIAPATFVVVGMAAFLGAVMRVPLGAVIMVAELTGDYQLLVPALWVCILAWLLTRRHRLYPQQVPSRFDAPGQLSDMMGEVLRRVSVREAMDPHKGAPVTVAPDMPIGEVLACFASTPQAVFPIVRPQTGALLGVVDGHALRRTLQETGHEAMLIAHDFASPAVSVRPVDTLYDAIASMTASGYDELVVVSTEDPGQLAGILTRREIIAAYHRRMLGAEAEAMGRPRPAAPPAPEPPPAAGPEAIPQALDRGAIVRLEGGGDRDQALARLVARAPLPETIDRDRLLAALIEREALGSTGIGDGLAIPHPSGELLGGHTQPLILVGLLWQPVPWNALDGVPVDTVCVLLTPSGVTHLRLLSHLARTLSDPTLRGLLRDKAPDEEIAARVAELAAQVA